LIGVTVVDTDHEAALGSSTGIESGPELLDDPGASEREVLLFLFEFELGQLLVELNREEGVTLIVVTHAKELAARMGKQLELKDGRLEVQKANAE